MRHRTRILLTRRYGLRIYFAALFYPKFSDDNIVNCSSDSAPVIVLTVLVEFNLHFIRFNLIIRCFLRELSLAA